MRGVTWVFMVLALVVVGGLMLQGCATQARIDQRFDEKVREWQAAHPGEQPTQETLNEIHFEAEAEVESEVAQERKAAVGKGLGVISAAVSGNWLAALFELVGLGGLGVAAYKKAKGVPA